MNSDLGPSDEGVKIWRAILVSAGASIILWLLAFLGIYVGVTR